MDGSAVLIFNLNTVETYIHIYITLTIKENRHRLSRKRSVIPKNSILESTLSDRQINNYVN
jgi:hypothetical protein